MMSIICLCPYYSVSVMITTSDSPTVGEMYTLECSATGPTDQPTITWLDDDIEINPVDATRRVSETKINSGGSYSRTLTFNPLAASDAGMFMCRATLGDTMQTASIAISVEGKCNVQIHENVYRFSVFIFCLLLDPTISVSVDDGVALSLIHI